MADHAEPGARPHLSRCPGHGRRKFLQRVCGGVAAAVGTQYVLHGAQSAPETPAGESAAPQKLPAIHLGTASVTRLVAGGNPVNGYSHSTRNLADHMREYFTVEATIAYFKRCYAAGINTFQSSHADKVGEALTRTREEGVPIQWLPISSAKALHPTIKKLLPLKPIAIAHHGSVTDTLFQTGKQEQVHDYVKAVHDAGLPAGISTHNPGVIAYAGEKGWENDFFMTCLYNVMRPVEEIRAKLGSAPLGEPFLEDDPERMTAAVRQTAKPCLAFKLLAAGRLCWTAESIEGAFKFALSNIKKTDGIIVGMYPRFRDEITENVQHTLRYCESNT